MEPIVTLFYVVATYFIFSVSNRNPCENIWVEQKIIFESYGQIYLYYIS